MISDSVEMDEVGVGLLWDAEEDAKSLRREGMVRRRASGAHPDLVDAARRRTRDSRTREGSTEFLEMAARVFCGLTMLRVVRRQRAKQNLKSCR